MKRILLAGCGVVLAFAACGKPPAICDPDALAQKAQICMFSTELNFNIEFGSGTFIGQKPINTFILRNGGVEDLNISSVLTGGDSEFTYTASWDPDPKDATIPGTVVQGNKKALIQVEFAPKAARLYSGSITLVTDAENSAQTILKVFGCGVPTDGGTSPCYGPDAGKP